MCQPSRSPGYEISRATHIEPESLSCAKVSGLLAYGGERGELKQDWAMCCRAASAGDARCRGSPDQLIGLEEERLGDRDPERVRSLEVDDQLELHGLLHRQVGRGAPCRILST